MAEFKERDIATLSDEQILQMATDLRLAHQDAEIVAVAARLERMKFKRELILSGRFMGAVTVAACW
jgi:hypothetical protein